MQKSVIYCSVVTTILLGTARPAFTQSENSESVTVVSNKLTRWLPDQKKKLDAIFYWVTDNIAYDVEGKNKSEAGQKVYPDFKIEATDSIERAREYNEAVANFVLEQKKAICDGYARLFKSLCNHANIECEVVQGNVKYVYSHQLLPHAWNAVKLNGRWCLVDPTWASGYVFLDSFEQERDMFYYLTPPQKMFVNHLPDDLKWTLLNESYNNESFKQSPVEDIRVVQKGLIDYYPKNRTINFKSGQLITVWLEFAKSPIPWDIDVSPTGPVDDKEIQVVSRKITNNQIEFILKPLSEIKGICIHVDYGAPALTYDIVYNAKNQ